MLTRRLMLALLSASFVPTLPALATEKLPVVASFSILGDFVRVIGGERVALTVLVGADGDAHVFQPTPADAEAVAAARLIVVNGLGFDGWMERLVAATKSKAPVVEAAAATPPLAVADHGHDHGHDHDHGVDPHAWQSVANAILYVGAIRDALISADPAGEAIYRGNADRYIAELTALDAEIRTMIAAIPPARRRVITNHDAFAAFGAAYGVDMIAPQGISTEADVSAADVATIIRRIREEAIGAVFLENIADPRLTRRISEETGAAIGGTLYSDALSGPDGPAATYVDMMRHNARLIATALKEAS